MNRTALYVDLDGTLTQTEILPAIAERAGVADQIGPLTAATLAGEVTFEESFRRRVEILKDVPLDVVHETILAQPVFQEFLTLLQSRRDDVVVVTGNLDVWVDPFLNHHGLRGIASRAELVDGRIVGVAEVLSKDRAFELAPADRVIAVGDGAADAPMVRAADIGIAWCGCHPAARPLVEVADYAFASEEVLCRFLRQWW